MCTRFVFMMFALLSIKKILGLDCVHFLFSRFHLRNRLQRPLLMDISRVPYGKDDRDYHEDPFHVVPEHQGRVRLEQQEGIHRQPERECNCPYPGDDIIYMHEGSALGTLGFHAFPGILESKGEMEQHRCPADDCKEQHREYRDVIREPVEF